MATNHKKYKLSTGTHYIANSGKDEKNGIKGGKAGDQTGHEAELRKWYNRPWSCVLRYPDQTVANLIADLSIEMCLNNNVGYDQGQRTTYWAQLKKHDYNPSLVGPSEQDCTAGVSSNVKAAGAILGIKALADLPICSSRNMKSAFTKAGFVCLTASKYLTSGKYLFPGDILLYVNHHAACNITCGSAVRKDWHPDEVPTPQGDTLRPGMTGASVKAMQKLLLLNDPKCLPVYGADGDYGSETEKAVRMFQHKLGLSATGICDKLTLDALNSRPLVVQATGDVNIRSAPSAESAKLGVLAKGSKLPYQMQARYVGDTPWYLVQYDGQNGWVSGKFSKIVG